MDFAFAIHSDVGSRCVGAKVNGKIVPLRYKLKNGDTVEVLTSPSAHPSKDWLTFVKTSRAQQKIRAFIKQQQREKSLQLGRELLEKEFRRFGLNLNKLLKSGELKGPPRSSDTASRTTCWSAWATVRSPPSSCCRSCCRRRSSPRGPSAPRRPMAPRPRAPTQTPPRPASAG